MAAVAVVVALLDLLLVVAGPTDAGAAGFLPVGNSDGLAAAEPIFLIPGAALAVEAPVVAFFNTDPLPGKYWLPAKK